MCTLQKGIDVVKNIYFYLDSNLLEIQSLYDNEVPVSYFFTIKGIAYRPVFIPIDVAQKFLDDYMKTCKFVGQNMVTLPISDYNGNVMYVELSTISYSNFNKVKNVLALQNPDISL